MTIGLSKFLATDASTPVTVPETVADTTGIDRRAENWHRRRGSSRNTREVSMAKFAERALIAGAETLAIVSAVGGAGLLGRARADNPPCVANAAADPCPQRADVPNPDPPPRNRIRVYCQPAGPHAGAHCFQHWIP